MKLNEKNLKNALASDDVKVFERLYKSNNGDGSLGSISFFKSLGSRYKSYVVPVLIKVLNSLPLREMCFGRLFYEGQCVHGEIHWISQTIRTYLQNCLRDVSNEEKASIRKAIFEEPLSSDEAFLTLFTTANDIYRGLDADDSNFSLWSIDIHQNRDVIFSYIVNHPVVFWALFKTIADLSDFCNTYEKIVSSPYNNTLKLDYASQAIALALNHPKKLEKLIKNNADRQVLAILLIKHGPLPQLDKAAICDVLIEKSQVVLHPKTISSSVTKQSVFKEKKRHKATAHSHLSQAECLPPVEVKR